MWFALFWMQPLREFWRRELGEKYFLKLQEVIPYSWPLDPTPLPQHAVIPRLEIHDWREAGKLSQKERNLLIKVSGFSPLGWGSRGIVVGSDVPQTEWEREIEQAFEDSGRALQLWLKAQLLTMAGVGLATGIGLWLVGMEGALALGLLAALLGLAE